MTGSLKPGDELVMAGWAGLDGSAVLVKEKTDHLKRVLPERILKNITELAASSDTGIIAGICESEGVSAMMEMSEGGVFGALWDMGAASNVGFEVDLKRILIRQESIEVCEIFDINPYLLRSKGAVLIGTDCGSRIVDRLTEEGVNAAVIGYVTGDADRVVKNGDSRRYLEPRHPDELEKVLDTKA